MFTRNNAEKTISYLCTAVLVLLSVLIINEQQTQAKAIPSAVIKPSQLEINRAIQTASRANPNPKKELIITSNKLTDSELVYVLESVGFSGFQLKQAWAIAKRESNGNANAFNGNPKTGDKSYGLFQINMIGSMGPDRRAKYGLASNESLFNPYTNAKVAYAMSNGGSDWGPWDVGSNAYNGGSNEPKYRYWLSLYPN